MADGSEGCVLIGERVILLIGVKRYSSIYHTAYSFLPSAVWSLIKWIGTCQAGSRMGYQYAIHA